jgi:hypothetical protein
MSTIVVLAAVAVLLVGLIVKSHRALRALQHEAERISSEVFVDSENHPKVAVTYSYGYPSVQVTFASREDLARASGAGLTQIFQNAIQERFERSGSKKYPFDASKAISFTSNEGVEAIASIDQERR